MILNPQLWPGTYNLERLMMDMEPVYNLMNKALVDNVFPGAVLLCAKDHNIICNKAFGLADLYTKRPVHTDSIFDLASLTKPLATALCISRLIESKMIRLDQTIGSILKPFQDTPKAQITIDMLLRHTSGLPAYIEYYTRIVLHKNDPRTYLRQLIVQEPLEYPPGSKQLYSDIGYMILSWIIEEVSKKRLDQIVFETVFEPCHLNRIFFIEHFNENNLAKGYERKLVSTQCCPWRKRVLTGEVDDDNAWAVGGIEGHAGLFGDTLSVYRLCREILSALLDQSSSVFNSQVLKEFIIKKQEFDMVAGFDTPSKINSSAGQFFSSSSIGHLGFTGTSFWIDPEASLIVILLTNRVHPLRSNETIRQFRPKLHDLIYSTLV